MRYNSVNLLGIETYISPTTSDWMNITYRKPTNPLKPPQYYLNTVFLALHRKIGNFHLIIQKKAVP